MKRAILLVDHGSRRREANAVLEGVAERVRERRPEWIVEIAHMELAGPSVAQGVDACVAAGADEVVVQPYFLAPGSHASKDVPELARDAAARHPRIRVRVGEPLGVHAGLVDAVLDRVDAAREERL